MKHAYIYIYIYIYNLYLADYLMILNITDKKLMLIYFIEFFFLAKNSMWHKVTRGDTTLRKYLFWVKPLTEFNMTKNGMYSNPYRCGSVY